MRISARFACAVFLSLLGSISSASDLHQTGLFNSLPGSHATGAPRSECVSACEKKNFKCNDDPKKCSAKRDSCVKQCPRYTVKDCKNGCEKEYMSCSGDMKKCAERRQQCVRSRC